MKPWLLLLTAPLLGVSTLAQTGPPKGALQGTVVNSVTGSPVKQATVQAMGPESKNTVSDAEGKFAFADLTPGTYRLMAQHPAYPQPVSGIPKRTEMFAVAPGETRKDVIVRLLPSGAISGRVIDMDGDPLRGCLVMLHAPSFQRGHRALMQMNGSNTNDRGEYRVYHLAPGEYYLSAKCQRPVPQSSGLRPASDRQDGSLAYALQYYPGSSDITGAGPVPVAAGSEVERIDFRLPTTPTFSIGGKLSVPPGASSLATELSLWPQEATSRMMGPVSGTSVPPTAGGQWKIAAVPPGTYEIRGSINTGTRQYSGMQSVTVRDAPLQNVSLELAALPEVTGTVHLEGDQATGSTNLFVSLIPMKPGPLTSGGYAQVKDGKFTMSNIVPGVYEILIQSQTPSYIKSTISGGQSISPYKFVVYPSGATVDIALGTKVAEIDGAVEGDASMIVLLPVGEGSTSTALQRVSLATSAGAFSFANIAPGEYRLAAVSGLEINALENPAVRELIDKSGESIRIAEGETVSKKLRAISLPQ